MEHVTLTFEKAYNYAIYLLSLKLRTEGELREKLKIKQYNVEIISEVIKTLSDNNYLDDQRYAEVYLDNLKKYKNFGFYGIKKKFMEKRLPSQIIESVLAEGLNEEDEMQIAEKFLKKQNFHFLSVRQSFGEGGMGREEKARLARKLAAKGFRARVVSRLLF